ncbi:putative nucleic acid-binding protein [Helianthus anomalus]
MAVLFRNEAGITSIITKNSWYIFTCSGSKCRKGLTQEDGYFICKACKSKVEYTRKRYILQLLRTQFVSFTVISLYRYALHLLHYADITDGTMNTVVVLFDEIAEKLVKRTTKSLVEEQLQDTSIDAPILPSALQSIIETKHTFEIKSHTYYHFSEYESFNCAKIIGPPLDCADKDVCPKNAGCACNFNRSVETCVEDSDDDTDGMTPGHMDLTGVIDDIDDGEKGSH